MQAQNNLQPSPIGIDLGTHNSKIAVAKRGGVEIITNQANFRQTPCIVGFGPNQRQIGEAGNIKMKSNFRDSIVAPMRFIGLTPDYPMLTAQKKFCPARTNISSGKIKFDVDYQGQKESMVSEQVLGAYINKLKAIIALNGYINKEAVIAIPPCLLQNERKEFLVAARIADFHVTRLLNESTAVALDYGMFRKSQFSQDARNVLFLDFGHSKLSIFCCSFSKQQMSVLYQDYERHIGCRNLDYLMYEFYREHFQKTSGGLDLEENRKAKVKLMENLERQRKTLTGIKEFELNVEYLMEDNDLHYTMTRENFNQISAPAFTRMKQLFVTARQTLKEKGIKLHSVELIGGGSRIPEFISIARQTFGFEPSRTLNSSQSIARGCALMAAIKSPFMKVQDYSLVEKVQYGIKMYWNFVSGNTFLGANSELYPQKQGKMIFQKGCKVPTSKTIKFSRKQPIQILIEYQPSIVGFNKHIAYYVTKSQHPKEDIFGVQFKVRYTDDGIVTVDDFSLVEEWTEQTKIPKKKPKPEQPASKPEGENKSEQQKAEPMQQQQFEIKKTKKERFTKIDYQANNFNTFSQKQINQFFSIESAMLNQDKMIVDTYQKKNLLESLVYKWKDRLTAGEYSHYAAPITVPTIISLINQINDWLYGEGQKSNRGTYVAKIQELQSKVRPIQQSYIAHSQYRDQLQLLMNAIAFNCEFLNSTVIFNIFQDEKYKHIDESMRGNGLKKIEETKKWVKDAEQASKDGKKWQKPRHSALQVKEKKKQLVNLVNSIMNRPPPKKEEPKEKEPETQPKRNGESQNKMEEQNQNNQKPESTMEQQK